MANFIFNEAAALANTGGLGWDSGEVVGVFYDDRLTVVSANVWDDISSYVVATSAPMTGRNALADKRFTGDPLRFTAVTTAPGLRIKGLVLKFTSNDLLVAHYDQGLDGFSGNGDIAIVANNVDIFARPPANNSNTWFSL